MPRPILFEPTFISSRVFSQERSREPGENAKHELPTLNIEFSKAGLHSTLDVGSSAFEVFCGFAGRVAESGLRHSTRNRAWGNPPWVRIPPLPRRIRQGYSESGLANISRRR